MKGDSKRQRLGLRNKSSTLSDLESHGITTFTDEEAVEKPSSPSQVAGSNGSHLTLLLALILLWYGAAIVAITTTKRVLLIVSMPYTLCLCQFTIATIATKVYSLFFAATKTSSNVFHMGSPVRRLLYQISTTYTLGFIFTNISFSLVNANFAETVKAAEPISSVALAYFFFRESVSRLGCLALLPICIGVAISCTNEVSFDIFGFMSAAMSNVCFSHRAVVAKYLFNTYPGANLDEMTMFHVISYLGLLILIPLVMLKEWGLVGLVRSEDFVFFVVLLVINGLAYTTYNVTSFYVLNRTNIITHAILNVFRRVFIIIGTSVYFGITLSNNNIIGIIIAFLGLILFIISTKKIEKS